MQFGLKSYLWFLKQTRTVHCFDFENTWMILNLITYLKKLCTFDDWKWVHFSCICKGSNYNLIQCAVKISSVLAFLWCFFTCKLLISDNMISHFPIWGKYFKDHKLLKKNSLVLINTTLHMKSCYYLHKLHSTHLNDHLFVY